MVKENVPERVIAEDSFAEGSDAHKIDGTRSTCRCDVGPLFSADVADGLYDGI